MASRVKTHPPSVSIGKGGPPPTMPSTWLRNQRQKLNDDALMLLAKARALPNDDPIREKLSNEAGVLRSRIHNVSQIIREEESR